VSPAAPVAPAAPPATNLTLTTDRGRGAAVPGSAITFVGGGFAPHSTVVLTMYSSPLPLGTDVTDGNGEFSMTVTLPADLAVGRHTALAQGAAPDGSIRSMATVLTVRSASTAATASLPVTGVDAMMLALAGFALALAGTGLVRAGRPRRG
jgi:hypothetical protein